MPAKTSRAIDPWAALDAIMATEPEPMGEEWFTADDVMERYGLSSQGARGRVLKLERQGKLDVWRGIMAKTRRCGKKYRLKKGAA